MMGNSSLPSLRSPFISTPSVPLPRQYGLRLHAEQSRLLSCPSLRKKSHFSIHKNLNLINKAKSRNYDEIIQREPQPEAMEPQKNIMNLVIRLIRPRGLMLSVAGFIGIMARTTLENYHLVTSLNWGIVSLKSMVLLSVMVSVISFINVINQISDVEIDKINKPYLPLSSGEVSIPAAWGIVLASVMHSIATAIFFKSKALLVFLVAELALGTIYSLPPLCTKRSTFGAIVTLTGMTGTVLHCLLVAASRAVFDVPFHFSPFVVFLSFFSGVFGAALGVLKDLPDLEGDKRNNVPTLAVTYGPRVALCIGMGFMILCYGCSAAAAVLYPQFFNPKVVVPAHLIFGSYLTYLAWDLDKKKYNKEAATTFYLYVWRLFFLEYFIYLFV